MHNASEFLQFIDLRQVGAKPLTGAKQHLINPRSIFPAVTIRLMKFTLLASWIVKTSQQNYILRILF
jgi:hypothetical protein